MSRLENNDHLQATYDNKHESLEGRVITQSVLYGDQAMNILPFTPVYLSLQWVLFSYITKMTDREISTETNNTNIRGAFPLGTPQRPDSSSALKLQPLNASQGPAWHYGLLRLPGLVGNVPALWFTSEMPPR